MVNAPARHKWSEPSRPSALRTERICLRCGMIRVTRHDGGAQSLPWTEYYDGDERLDAGPGGKATPPCVERAP